MSNRSCRSVKLVWRKIVHSLTGPHSSCERESHEYVECCREDGYGGTIYTSREGKLSIVCEWLNCCNPAIEANICRRLRSSALIQGFDSSYDGAWMQKGVLSVNAAKVCFQQNLSVFTSG